MNLNKNGPNINNKFCKMVTFPALPFKQNDNQ